MTEQPWATKFEETLRGFLPLLADTEPIRPDLRLADLGLDSLATVSLLLEVEEAFEVTIPDHLLTEDTFATPAGLWSVVESLLVRDPVD